MASCAQLVILICLPFLVCCYSDYAVYSNFTLAFFEDSGWYQVNRTYIEAFDQFELQWGRGNSLVYSSFKVRSLTLLYIPLGLGCEFAMEPCDNSETYPYLCNEDIIHQCTFDHISRVSFIMYSRIKSLTCLSFIGLRHNSC